MDLKANFALLSDNQRDYIFIRRHRYVFRDKRSSEKSVIGPDGKEVKGVEDIRAGLQELGYVNLLCFLPLLQVRRAYPGLPPPDAIIKSQGRLLTRTLSRPRFTMKLRRIDKGIQRGSGQEWEWKVRMEKQRTKFQL